MNSPTFTEKKKREYKANKMKARKREPNYKKELQSTTFIFLLLLYHLGDTKKKNHIHEDGQRNIKGYKEKYLVGRHYEHICKKKKILKH